MTDADIVTLYWARDEQAIAQTAQKFGAYCRKIAMNLLGSQEDAEECENDTWMAAWNSMPQNRPDKLAPYLGRITRNLALDLRERQNAKKRGGGQTETVLEELEFCLPAGDHTAQEVESRHATSLFGGTGTATPLPTLPSATVLAKARCALPCTGCAPN